MKQLIFAIVLSTLLVICFGCGSTRRVQLSQIQSMKNDPNYSPKKNLATYSSFTSDSNWIKEDENIRFIVTLLGTNKFSEGNVKKASPSLDVATAIQNKTKEMLYIDLGNSFFLNNGYSEPYYTPGELRSTSGTTSGVSVNLGSVAAAAGIGGAAGTLAKGINVGNSHQNGVTNITYAQRIVVIPPKSTITLELKSITPLFNRLENMSWILHTYSNEDSPVRGNVLLCYSKSQDCKDLIQIENEFYQNYMLGVRTWFEYYYVYMGWYIFDSCISEVIPNWKEYPHVVSGLTVKLRK